MDKYTIYCTEAQTRKAAELGAPIDFKCHVVHYLDGGYSYEIEEKNGEPILETPTAEQMISWAEEQGFVIEIILSDEEHPWTFAINKVKDVCVYDTRKEATLAAIDAALEYLIKNKK